MSFEKFLKKDALTADSNQTKMDNQNSKKDHGKNCNVEDSCKDKDVRFFQSGEAERKKRAAEEKLNVRKSCKNNSGDVGESRGGFSCERHSFDGERKVPLTKKPYEGNGTFGTNEHRGSHHKPKIEKDKQK